MKKLLVFAVIAMVAGSAFANGGWWDEYIWLSINGGESEQYQLGTGGAGIALDGADLGSLYSLTLTDISIKYWNEAQDRTGGNLFWQIFDGVESDPIVGPSGIAWTQTATGGNDYIGEWSGSQSLLGSATYNESQTYYIQFWANNDGTTDRTYWLNNGNDPENYQATFETAIPEPATMSLLGLGALAMVIRRKLSK